MRPTKEFITSSSQKFVLYTYLTAGESNAIKALMMSAMKIDIADLKEGVEAPLKGQIDGTILMEQEKLMVKSLVKESPVPTEELPEADYAELVAELNKIKGANLVKAK